MTQPINVKICGVTDPAHLPVIAKAGARYVGFVLYPRSPRAVTLEALASLLAQTPPNLETVALCVDPDDELIQRLTRLSRLNMLQLHGHETPQRVAAIRSLWQRPIMKALSLTQAEDLAAASAYAPLVEQFLFDAKPPEGGLPGGNALAFDWQILAGRTFPKPWLLAGGLTAANVAQAIAISGAKQVDVSSGVEDAPGKKSAGKIMTFCEAARGAG